MLPDTQETTREAALEARRQHRAMRRLRIRILLHDEGSSTVDCQDASDPSLIPSPHELVWVSNRKSEDLRRQLISSGHARSDAAEVETAKVPSVKTPGPRTHHRRHVSSNADRSKTPPPPLTSFSAGCIPIRDPRPPSPDSRETQATSSALTRLPSDFMVFPDIPEDSPQEVSLRPPFAKSLLVHLPAEDLAENPFPLSPGDVSSPLSGYTASPRPPSVPCSPRGTPKGTLGPRHGRHIKTPVSPRDHFAACSPKTLAFMSAASESSPPARDKLRSSPGDPLCLLHPEPFSLTPAIAGNSAKDPPDTATSPPLCLQQECRSLSAPCEREMSSLVERRQSKHIRSSALFDGGMQQQQLFHGRTQRFSSLPENACVPSQTPPIRPVLSSGAHARPELLNSDGSQKRVDSSCSPLSSLGLSYGNGRERSTLQEVSNPSEIQPPKRGESPNPVQMGVPTAVKPQPQEDEVSFVGSGNLAPAASRTPVGRDKVRGGVKSRSRGSELHVEPTEQLLHCSMEKAGSPKLASVGTTGGEQNSVQNEWTGKQERGVCADAEEAALERSRSTGAKGWESRGSASAVGSGHEGSGFLRIMHFWRGLAESRSCQESHFKAELA